MVVRGRNSVTTHVGSAHLRLGDEKDVKGTR